MDRYQECLDALIEFIRIERIKHDTLIKASSLSQDINEIKAVEFFYSYPSSCLSITLDGDTFIIYSASFCNDDDYDMYIRKISNVIDLSAKKLPTPEQIKAVRKQCQNKINNYSQYETEMTYEEGILDTIKWIQGDGPSPME